MAIGLRGTRRELRRGPSRRKPTATRSCAFGTDQRLAYLDWNSLPYRFNVLVVGALSEEVGGRERIRTSGRIAPTPDFESGAFNHSATLPLGAQEFCSNWPGRQADSSTRVSATIQFYWMNPVWGNRAAATRRAIPKSRLRVAEMARRAQAKIGHLKVVSTLTRRPVRCDS